MTLTMEAPTLEAPAESVPFVCPPDHTHGRTVSCYKTHGCRCQPCRAICARKELERNRAKRDGRYAGGARHPERAARHIESLMREGMTMAHIAERSGIAYRTVGEILARKRPILGATERAVLQTRLYLAPAPQSNVNSLGTRRRLQALMAIGYTLQDLSLRLGKNRSWASKCLTEYVEVEEATRLDVARLYDELSMTPAPDTVIARRSIARAKKFGYVKPLGWDDIDTDAEPAQQERRCHVGHLIVNGNAKPVRNRGGEVTEKCFVCWRAKSQSARTGEYDIAAREDLYRRFVPYDNPDVDAVDQEAVDLALKGIPGVALNYRERRAAVRIAYGWRWSDGLIAYRLNINSRDVMRIRHELELPGLTLEEVVTIEDAAA